MGVDIATYRSRIGCIRHSTGQDVVHLTVHINFTHTIKLLCIILLLLLNLLFFTNKSVLFAQETCDFKVLDLWSSSSVFTGFHMCLAAEKKTSRLKYSYAVVFIGVLLIIAGIETNPGPLPKNDEAPKQKTKQMSDTSLTSKNTGKNPSLEHKLKNVVDHRLNETVETGERYDTDTEYFDAVDNLERPKSAMKCDAGVLEQHASRIRYKMGLTDYFPGKLTLKDIMKIATTPEVTGNTDLHWTLLRELIMVNFEARNMCPYKLFEQGLGQSDGYDSDSSDDDGNDEMDQAFNIDILKTQDIFITIFNCCDHFLKQVLVSKMFLCRLAVPLIYPTFQPDTSCFSLWALRGISLDLKEQKHTSLFLAKYPQKVVSFVRLSRPKFSKSLLLNAVISNQQDQHHPTFYNKECLLGIYRREITNGLVEASWYLPGGQNVFQDVIMFTNLRGDAADHLAQMKSLTDMSHCLVVTIDRDDIMNHLDILKNLKDRAKAIIIFLTGQKLRSILKKHGDLFLGMKIVTLYEKKAEKNISTVRIEMQKMIVEQLKNSNDISLEDCASCASNYGIRIDERSEMCNTSKQTALGLFQRMEKFSSANVKKKLLPLQDLWRDISKYTKNLKRTDTLPVSSTNGTSLPNEDFDATSTLLKKEPIRHEISKLRCEQSRLSGDIHSLAQMFIQVLVKNIDDKEYMSYFLEWTKFHFDERSQKILPELMNNYHKCWAKYNESKPQGNRDIAETFRKEMRIAEQQWLDASFGLEHLLREMGQIYESSKENQNGYISDEQKVLFEKLPTIAAKLLLLGYPLELMDGDAGNLPIIWIKAIFDACIKLLGDKKVFIISVLGIQSSGKSTLLNSLFALRFAVSAGRCTKGIYLQIIPVDSNDGFSVEYLLVVDTEGLRAPELAIHRYNHDNELATLAVGLADMTIVNIKGENTSEVKDVLEIVIHAMLRLKLANANLYFNTSCAFVHQNVSAPNAASKMELGRQNLLDLLDEVTREAALELGIKDTQVFQQVIKFDILNDVWYLPDLWNSDPPMAHINPGYSKKVSSIKNTILNHLRSKTYRSFTTTIIHILDLWNGICSDDFVFSFRNSLEVKAFNILEREYRKCAWALQEFQMKWTLQHEDRVGMDLSEKDFAVAFNVKYEGELSKLKHFFEYSQYKQELLKWKDSQFIQFRILKDILISRTKTEFSERRDKTVLREKIRKMNESHLEEVHEQAKKLAESLKGQKVNQAPEEQMEDHFNYTWSQWLKKLSLENHTEPESLGNQIYDILLNFNSQLRSHIILETDRQDLFSKIKFLYRTEVSEYGKHIHVRPMLGSRGMVNSLKQRPFNQSFQEECTFQQQLFHDIDLQVDRDINKESVRFQNGHLFKLLFMIESRIDQHNDNNDDFEFLPQYRAMIMVYVSRYVLHVFTEVNERYDKEYSPRAIIEEYKSTTWRVFKNLVEGKTHDSIIATLVCEAIKANLKEKLHRHAAITIESRVRDQFSHSKTSLIINILDDLAKSENFEMYKAYLTSAGSYALKWIKLYTVNRFFSDPEYARTSEYLNIVSNYTAQCLEDFKTDICNACKKCKLETERKTETFISSVRGVYIPEHTAKKMREYELHDVENFLSEVHQILTDLQNEITEEHKCMSIDKVKWITSLCISIYQGLWGCNELCPLCKEPCQIMAHSTCYNDLHTCVQHKPRGLTGGRWRSNDELVIESCSYCVQSPYKTTCSVFRKGCRKHAGCKSEIDVFHPFKEYKKYLPEWDIAPSSDMESSKYWMWFIAKFKTELAECYSAKTPKVPKSWKSISKEEAIDSLRICYGY